MATNPSEANINTLIVELMGRMCRLEAENRELKGKMEQNSEGNGPNWTGAIDNLEKKLMSSIEKISSDMKADAVYQKYETDAIAIEKEEQWKREKEELMAEISRLRRETEDGLSCIRNDFSGRLKEVEVKKLMTSIEKISSDMEKLTQDVVFQKYEIDALGIENDEMKRIQRETEDGLSCIRNDFSGRLKEVSDKQQGVSDAITALQEGIAEISHKIGRIEGKQSEDHLTILARPVPLKEKRQLIPGQVDKGTILVLGGENYIRDGNWDYYTRSGIDDMVILKQNKWIKLTLKLPKILIAGGAVYLDGEIYVFGGRSRAKELYKLDNKTLEWIRLADMNEGRRCITNSSVEWNGSIWVFGGIDLKSVERYDPKKNKWMNMPDMKYSRYTAAAAVHNGKFIVCGGYDDSNDLKSVECFDPESGVWTELNNMPTPLYHHFLVSYGNNLILMGGYDGTTEVNTVLEVSNLEGKGTWKQLPPMKQPRYNFPAAVLDNEIFVIGGSNGIHTYLDKTEIFNGKSWREGPQLPYRCSKMSSIVIPRHLADTLSNYTE